jgi:hypothetical protein
MHKTIIHVLPKDKFSMLCMENLSLGQDIHECLVHGELVLKTEHKWVSCAWRTCTEDRTSLSVLQDIHLCPVLRTSYPCTRHSFMFCPKDKFSIHKALVYILSWGHVLLDNLSLGRTSMIVLCIEHLSLGQDINECLVNGWIVLMTGHKWVPYAWRTFL